VHSGDFIGIIKSIKGVIAAQLLLLFLFHNLGFFIVYVSIIKQQEKEWSMKVVENNFTSTQYEMASIPISLPYQPDQKEFTDVNENIELNGNFYRIVKKRYEKDTMHIVFINDQTNDKINKQFAGWADDTGNRDFNTTSNENRVNIPVVDYQYLLSDFTFTSVPGAQVKSKTFSISQGHADQIVLNIPSPPPEYIVFRS